MAEPSIKKDFPVKDLTMEKAYSLLFCYSFPTSFSSPSSLDVRNLPMTLYGCRLNCNLPLIPKKYSFAGEISGSLFVSGQQN